MNSDPNGFLIADRRIGAEDMVTLLRDIRHDTSTLIRLLSGQSRSSVLRRARPVSPPDPARPLRNGSTSPAGQRDYASVPVPRGTPTSRLRDGRGRFVGEGERAAGAVERAVLQMTRQQAQEAARTRREAASRRSRGEQPDGSSGQARDARGRFGAGRGGTDGDGSSKSEKGGVFARLKSLLPGGGAAVGGDIERVDPAIEAANELHNLVSGPLKGIGEVGKAVIGRGFNSGEQERDPAEPWYRRMLVQLRLLRRESRADSQAERRTIIDARPDGGGGIIATVLKALFGPIGVLLVTALAAGWAAIGDKISGAWSAALGKITGLFEPIAAFFKDKLGIVSQAGEVAVTAANNAVKNATGVDVREGVKKASDAVQTKGGSLLEKLLPGFRHKADFTGIKGGESLRENGRYTDAEAARIRQLKTSGANTSANLPGGMPKAIRDKIIAEAKAQGVDPNIALGIAAMESGGNVNAISSTGAIGLYQLVGKTASGLGVKDRFDADQNIAGGVKLAKQNMRLLADARLPQTAENLYMMHQLGPAAATEMIAGAASGKTISALSDKTREAVGHNFGAKSVTAKEYMAKNGAALQARTSAAVSKVAPVAPMVPLAAPSIPRAVSIPSAATSSPAPPPPAPRADIPTPLTSAGPMVVTLANDRMANQDVADRRLAQIATGGLSSGTT